MGIKPVKLLIVHSQTTSSDCGGSFTILRYFLQGLSREQFDVHVAFSLLNEEPDVEHSKPIKLLRDLGAKIHPVYVPMNQKDAGIGLQIKFVFDLLTATLRLFRIIRREKVDLVYTNSLNIMASGFAARLAGVPSLYHVHEIVRRPPKLAALLARMVGKLADRIICVSEAAKLPFREVSVSETKLFTVPNCIDLNEFDLRKTGEAFRDEFCKGEKDLKLVASVGRILPKKGHHHVIASAREIVARLPNVRFFIVGDIQSVREVYTDSLLEQVKKAGLEKHVIFTGTRYDIPDLMAAMDVVVLAAASEATPESFGMVVIEALAMGTPVVATELGGIPDITHDGINGYLIPPNDVPSMSAAILRLLENAEEARKMGETGQKWVRREFDARSYSGKVVEVIMGVLDRNSLTTLTHNREENESVVAH